MLTSILLRDYKSYRGDVAIPLRRLTILLGKNNSGKTAAARLPLLILSAAARRGEWHRHPVPLEARGLQFGSSLLELVHGNTPHGGFLLGCTAERPHDPATVRLAVEVQLQQALGEGTGAFVSSFEATPLLDAVSWTRDLTSRVITYNDADVDGFDGILPRYHDLTKPGSTA